MANTRLAKSIRHIAVKIAGTGENSLNFTGLRGHGSHEVSTLLACRSAARDGWRGAMPLEGDLVPRAVRRCNRTLARADCARGTAARGALNAQ
ncbi:MAG: hypothetical protein ACRCV5_03410, partial [Afipia sp.]